MMGELIPKQLSKSEKTVATVAAVLIIAALLDHFIFRTIIVRMGETEEQIKTQELLLRKDLKMIDQKDLIMHQEREFAGFQIQSKTQEEEISEILKEIEVLASENSILLSDVKPKDLKTEKAYKVYYLTLNCEASMENLTRFMTGLQNSRLLFSIDSYDITIKDKEKGVVRCSLSLSKLVVL
jgi:Tfp pilus assembly protein PilO